MQQFTLSAQPRLLRYGILGGRIHLRRHPLISKAIPTAVGFAFGDCLTQYLNKPKREEEAYEFDWMRTAKMGALGAVVAGPIGLWFFQWMNANLLTQGPVGLAMGVKVLLDQVLGCILWQAAFLSIHEPYRMAAGQLIRNTSEGLQGQTSSLRKRLLPAV